MSLVDQVKHLPNDTRKMDCIVCSHIMLKPKANCTIFFHIGVQYWGHNKSDAIPYKEEAQRSEECWWSSLKFSPAQ